MIDKTEIYRTAVELYKLYLSDPARSLSPMDCLRAAVHDALALVDGVEDPGPGRKRFHTGEQGSKRYGAEKAVHRRKADDGGEPF